MIEIYDSSIWMSSYLLLVSHCIVMVAAQCPVDMVHCIIASIIVPLFGHFSQSLLFQSDIALSVGHCSFSQLLLIQSDIAQCLYERRSLLLNLEFLSMMPMDFTDIFTLISEMKFSSLFWFQWRHLFSYFNGNVFLSISSFFRFHHISLEPSLF